MSDFWKGIALDWGVDIPSVFEPKNDYDVIRSSVLWIVLTQLGERCIAGDTKIPLVDGTEVTVKDLVGKGKFRVYSYDKELETVVPGLAEAFQTHDKTQLVEVILDNNEKLRCTPDHRFMLRDGSYRQAKDLKPGDSLMPSFVNHKVLCVHTVEEQTSVYDLHVEKYHNFAVSAGVFVHNCMLPDFGSNLANLVFDPNDDKTAQAIKTSVRTAIAKWDDRVTFVDFVVKPDGVNLKCTLSYKINADRFHDTYQTAEILITPEMFGG